MSLTTGSAINAPHHSSKNEQSCVQYGVSRIFSAPTSPHILASISTAQQQMNLIAATRSYIHAQNNNPLIQCSSTPTNLQLPEYPIFTTSPSPDISNVGTGTAINIWTALSQLDPSRGTHDVVGDAMLEFICDYANRFHGTLFSINCHSPGSSPKFLCFDTGFLDRLREHGGHGLERELQRIGERLSREGFWRLRYLFIPVRFLLAQGKAHVALCTISPEARTVDYLCSCGDDALSPHGSQPLPWILHFLTLFLSSSPSPFNSSEWRLRTTAAYLQSPESNDCMQYMITHAQLLAFGYSLNSKKRTYGERTWGRMADRRLRIVADLFVGGFRGWDGDAMEDGSGEEGYYPLLDVPPTNDTEDGWYPLDIALNDATCRYGVVGQEHHDESVSEEGVGDWIEVLA